MRMLIAMLALVASATAGWAQGLPDHLQCYKITDTSLRRLRGTVDLAAPAIGVAPGCRLGKAKSTAPPRRRWCNPGPCSTGRRRSARCHTTAARPRIGSATSPSAPPRTARHRPRR